MATVSSSPIAAIMTADGSMSTNERRAKDGAERGIRPPGMKPVRETLHCLTVVDERHAGSLECATPYAIRPVAMTAHISG